MKKLNNKKIKLDCGVVVGIFIGGEKIDYTPCFTEGGVSFIVDFGDWVEGVLLIRGLRGNQHEFDDINFVVLDGYLCYL